LPFILSDSSALSARWDFAGSLDSIPITTGSPTFVVEAKNRRQGMFMDERDISIRQKAKFVALHVFFAVFVSTWTALWATNRLHDLISIDRVIALPLAGLFVLIFAESIATLVQYARGK
jgi:hypothetical protein